MKSLAETAPKKPSRALKKSHGGDRKSQDYKEQVADALALARSMAEANKAKVKKLLEDFRTYSPEAQRDAVKALWQEAAYVTALRASSFAQTCGVREGDRLYDLIKSASSAYDKGYPAKENAGTEKDLLALFGSLGGRLAQIAQPALPAVTVTVQPKQIAGPAEPATTTTEESCSSNLNDQLSPVSSLPPLGAGWPDASKPKLSSKNPIPSPPVGIVPSSLTSKSASRSSTKTRRPLPR